MRDFTREPWWYARAKTKLKRCSFSCDWCNMFLLFQNIFGLSWDQPSELNYDKTHDSQSPNLTWINTRNLCCSCWVCHQIFSKFKFYVSGILNESEHAHSIQLVHTFPRPPAGDGLAFVAQSAIDDVAAGDPWQAMDASGWTPWNTRGPAWKINLPSSTVRTRKEFSKHQSVSWRDKHSKYMQDMNTA